MSGRIVDAGNHHVFDHDFAVGFFNVVFDGGEDLTEFVGFVYWHQLAAENCVWRVKGKREVELKRLVCEAIYAFDNS